MSFNYALIPADAMAVTKSDSTALSLCGLYVGGVGDVAVTTALGNDVIFSAVPVGTVIMLAISKVKATGTSATNIVGFLSS